MNTIKNNTDSRIKKFVEGSKITIYTINGTYKGTFTLEVKQIGIGSMIYFYEGKKAIGPIILIENEENDKIKVTTNNNEVFILQCVSQSGELTHNNQKSLSETMISYPYKDVNHFETAQGSTYYYQPNGTNIRHKKRGDNIEIYDPMPLLVFFQCKTEEQHQNFLKAYRKDLFPELKQRLYVIDKEYNIIRSNVDAEKAGSIYLAIVSKDKTKIFDKVPVTLNPTVGFNTYDQRTNNNHNTSRHIGNKVTKVQIK